MMTAGLCGERSGAVWIGLKYVSVSCVLLLSLIHIYIFRQRAERHPGAAREERDAFAALRRSKRRIQMCIRDRYEDVRDSILPMARTGSEATASMGADIPLAVLSECRPPLFDLSLIHI